MGLSHGGRREVLIGGTALLLARNAEAWASASQGATPDCGRGGKTTRRDAEGPYFKPRSPERAALVEPGMPGSSLVLAGRVLSTDCQPIAGALLDFWQADAGGNYDNTGFRLRGHQFADAAGRYRLATIVPGLYPGRTRHIHVKVQAPHGRLLTTQLYFPAEPHNRDDFLFREELLIALDRAEAGAPGRFDFVLDLG
jgi:protocatechuate 3,4-dioxygenase beta subunit